MPTESVGINVKEYMKERNIHTDYQTIIYISAALIQVKAQFIFLSLRLISIHSFRNIF